MQEQNKNIVVGDGEAFNPLTAQKDQSRAGFIMDLVAMVTGVPADDIRKQTRSQARTARARQVAMYLAYVAYSWSLARTGAAFGRDRTTAGYACRLVEEMRDDRGFDMMLERLEMCLRAVPEPGGVRLLAPNLEVMV